MPNTTVTRAIPAPITPATVSGRALVITGAMPCPPQPFLGAPTAVGVNRAAGYVPQQPQGKFTRPRGWLASHGGTSRHFPPRGPWCTISEGGDKHASGGLRDIPIGAGGLARRRRCTSLRVRPLLPGARHLHSGYGAGALDRGRRGTHPRGAAADLRLVPLRLADAFRSPSGGRGHAFFGRCRHRGGLG